jgi:hypothetical protein
VSKKPVIFISHSSKDEDFAFLIGQQIERAFDQRIEAFVARYKIRSGEEWRPEILKNLKQMTESFSKKRNGLEQKGNSADARPS